MSSQVIICNNIGKKYQLGFIRRNDTLRDKLAIAFKNKIQTLKGAQTNPGKLNSEKEFWALKNVSFTIEQGEVVGIIGRNGAGKSTLLKLLSRITEPTEGEIRLKGRVASLLEVGTGFHPELSGRENIYMNGAILGMTRSEIRSKFDEIVAFAEVEKFIDTPVKRYSSGMYVRLAFAVAAHLEPEILLVDEVLAVGDAEFQKKCLGKMQDVSKGGRTILFVSHNMGAIRNLVKKCVLVHEGRILYKGDTDTCINKYLNLNSEKGLHAAKKFNDRSPTEQKPIAIESIKLVSPNRGETCEFILGEAWSIQVGLKSIHDSIKFQSALVIMNQYGINVYHLVFKDSGIEYFESKKKFILKATLKKINLYPGRYYVTVWIGQPGHHTVTMDFIESAISFDVIQNEGERSLNKPMAVVHEIADWKLIPDNNF